MVATIYGRPHVRARARWATAVAAGRVTCWRCTHPITAGQPWDLGHRTGLHSAPEHAGCNRRAGGRDGANRAWARRRQLEVGGSRAW